MRYEQVRVYFNVTYGISTPVTESRMLRDRTRVRVGDDGPRSSYPHLFIPIPSSYLLSTFRIVLTLTLHFSCCETSVASSSTIQVNCQCHASPPRFKRVFFSSKKCNSGESQFWCSPLFPCFPLWGCVSPQRASPRPIEAALRSTGTAST
jgi:hypothetical protein